MKLFEQSFEEVAASAGIILTPISDVKETTDNTPEVNALTQSLVVDLETSNTPVADVVKPAVENNTKVKTFADLVNETIQSKNETTQENGKSTSTFMQSFDELVKSTLAQQGIVSQTETKVETTVEEAKVEPTVEEAKVEPTAEEAKVETTVEDAKVEPTVEEAKVEPTVEETVEEPKVEPMVEKSKVEPKVEAKSENVEPKSKKSKSKKSKDSETKTQETDITVSVKFDDLISDESLNELRSSLREFIKREVRLAMDDVIANLTNILKG